MTKYFIVNLGSCIYITIIVPVYDSPIPAAPLVSFALAKALQCCVPAWHPCFIQHPNVHLIVVRMVVSEVTNVSVFSK